MEILKKLFPKWNTTSKEAIFNQEQLTSLFKSRYHNYKLLVGANNKVLEIISEMERFLNGEGIFYGTSYIKSRTTQLSVNVLRAIKNLDDMKPNKYTNLYTSFEGIRKTLDNILDFKTINIVSTKIFNNYILPFKEVSRDNINDAGSKMAILGELYNSIKDVYVPEGFIMTSYLYEQFIKHNDLKSEIERLFQLHETDKMDSIFRLSSAISKAIMTSKMPPSSVDEIYKAYEMLEKSEGFEVRVSLRSSASFEDSIDSSFAGQYTSKLNVSREFIINAYKEVLASKYSPTAIAYRLNMGLWDEDISMCVGCMVMVDAAAGGVIYTRNPIDNKDDSIIITSVFGLPTSVVDGTTSVDMFIVSRADLNIIKRDIPQKKYAVRLHKYDGLIKEELIPELAKQESLADEKIIELARIALKLEEYFSGISQDIEWAINQQGKIYILQCRPFKQDSAKEATNVSQTISKGNDKYVDDIISTSGQRASSGKAGGLCYVINKDAHMLTFPEKSILIAPFAIPKLAALLGKASAIITQEGSLVGHLASVAREYKIPAIFNVSNIMEIVKNDEPITVDADNMVIYSGIKDDIIKDSRIINNLRKGSQIEKILSDILKIIAPLNLLDPDSDDFRPEKCQTYHDIIRFCHEKSVNELFAFGRHEKYSRHTCKELISNLPLHWLVIDLEDGFKGEIKGRKIHIKDINSAPFLSLWEGLSAVTWNGPQHIDVGGFLSVVLRHNSGGDAALSNQGSYENDNYVLLSKHFFSLSSRLGYHFCTIEALAGDRKAENYAGFYFKGGAADFQRRNLRIQFIGEILENFQFNITIKGDSLRAKINAFEETKLLTKIKILGYMLMHTRQLDMVMLNSSCVDEYRTKFISEINLMIKE
jgi:pyruvate,water dikinase